MDIILRERDGKEDEGNHGVKRELDAEATFKASDHSQLSCLRV